MNTVNVNVTVDAPLPEAGGRLRDRAQAEVTEALGGR
jgi:hypothetical protein